MLRSSTFAAWIATLFLTGCGSAEDVTVNTSGRLHGIAVLVDLSESNPILESAPYAAKVAEDAKLLFDDRLRPGSPVSFSTFGTYDVRLNPTLAEAKISKSMRPRDAADRVATAIREIPALIADEANEIVPQADTNAVAALTELSWRIDCKTIAYDVILVSDGRESSQDYGEDIPLPDERWFEDCGTLHIVGLNGDSPMHTQKLARQWKAFGAAAGFTRVVVNR